MPPHHSHHLPTTSQMQHVSLWPLQWTKDSMLPQPHPPNFLHHHSLVLSNQVLHPSILHHQILPQSVASHHSPLLQISLNSPGHFASQHNCQLQRHGGTYYHPFILYVCLKRLQLQGWFFRISIAATCICNSIIKRSKGRSQSDKRLSKHLREEYSQVISS